MNYEFPKIFDISQVEAAIDGRKEFIRADRDHFTVFNYVVMGNATFPNVTDETTAILRECRGLIFDLDGKVLSRPFHKFFNLGEREETFRDNIDWSMSHVLPVKLDGSMIRPLYIKEHNGFRWGTKMGITSVGMNCERWVSDKIHYLNFAEECHNAGITPIFEWTSPENRIVIKYDEPELTLLAMRYNVTGNYIPYWDMTVLANSYNIPYVRLYDFSMNHDDLIDSIRKVSGIEGIVVRFENDHMIKIKGEDYVLCHKAKEYIENPRYIIEMVLNEKIDDLISLLSEEDRNYTLNVVNSFEAAIYSYIDGVEDIYEEVKNLDRKTFALSYTNLSAITRAAIFEKYNGGDIRKFLVNKFSNLTNNEKNFELLKKEISLDE